jgi:hypothetical protein
MKLEIANAMMKQPQSLKGHQKVGFVLSAFVLCYFIGWLIFAILGGRHYLWLAASAFPILILSSIAGRLLRAVILPLKPAVPSSGAVSPSGSSSH